MCINYEAIYKELINVVEDEQNSASLAEVYNPSFWDDRYDNISQEEWLETLEIHANKRKEMIDKLLKGEVYVN